MGHGILSGTTLAVSPSGVTIDAGGIQIGSYYFIRHAGTNTKMVSGIADAANNKSPGGASLAITTGLTGVSDIWLSIKYTGTATSTVSRATWTGTTSVCNINTFDAAGGPATPHQGTSIAWTAFGW
jgi:hypothetical protein